MLGKERLARKPRKLERIGKNPMTVTRGHRARVRLIIVTSRLVEDVAYLLESAARASRAHRPNMINLQTSTPIVFMSWARRISQTWVLFIISEGLNGIKTCRSTISYSSHRKLPWLLVNSMSNFQLHSNSSHLVCLSCGFQYSQRFGSGLFENLKEKLTCTAVGFVNDISLDQLENEQ